MLQSRVSQHHKSPNQSLWMKERLVRSHSYKIWLGIKSTKWLVLVTMFHFIFMALACPINIKKLLINCCQDVTSLISMYWQERHSRLKLKKLCNEEYGVFISSRISSTFCFLCFVLIRICSLLQRHVQADTSNVRNAISLFICSYLCIYSAKKISAFSVEAKRRNTE